MSQFINKKNKLKYMNSVSKDTERDGLLQQDKNNNITSQINKEAKIYSFNKIVSDMSTDWQDFGTVILDEDYPYASGYISFTLNFAQFDIRLLPYINIKPVYRKGIFSDFPNFTFNDSYNTQNLGINYLIDDIPDEQSEYYKQVSIVVNLNVLIRGTTAFDYQVKFNVMFTNPLNYS